MKGAALPLRMAAAAAALLLASGAGAAAEPEAGAALAAAPRIATPHGFTVAESHPRLWWTPERLARARAWLASNRFRPGSSDWLHQAWLHVVAGADCGPAIGFALGHQVPARQWSPQANGSDDARWHGELAILVYDWCHDQLTPQQRRDFLDNLGGSGKGWNQYLDGIRQQAWGGPRMTQSNYNWGNLRNNLAYAIATWTENRAAAEPLLADAISSRWEKHFVPAAAGAGGGVGQEGTAYGVAPLQYPIIPFATVAQGGRNLWDETGFHREAVLWILYATSPAPTRSSISEKVAFQLSPFGDDEVFLDGGVLALRNYYQDYMTFAASQWAGTDLGSYARQWVETVGSHPSVKRASPFILAQAGPGRAKALSALPLDYYATGVQYLYGRKAWDESSTWFLWQMGKPQEGVGHQHIDTGNFNLWRGGRWLTRETTGYASMVAGYGRGSQATDDAGGIIGHNGIVFGTPLYQDGVRLMPSVDRGQSVVRRLESRPGWVYADVDMTRRYLWSTNYDSYNTGAVVHVERELLFLRDLETTVILDRITTGDVRRGPDAGRRAADQVNTFLLHFEAPPKLEDASHLTAVNGDQALRVTTLVPPHPVRRVIEERACAGCNPRVGQHRVEIDTSGTAQRYFLHVLQGRDADGPNIEATVVDSQPDRPEAGTFTVTLRPASSAPTTVILEKGQSSRGGTVRLAGGAAAELAAGVQQIRYTPGGPEWSSR